MKTIPFMSAAGEDFAGPLAGGKNIAGACPDLPPGDAGAAALPRAAAPHLPAPSGPASVGSPFLVR